MSGHAHAARDGLGTDSAGRRTEPPASRGCARRGGGSSGPGDGYSTWNATFSVAHLAYLNDAALWQAAILLRQRGYDISDPEQLTPLA